MRNKVLTIDQIRNDPSLYLSFYTYTFNVVSIAAGATATDIINIENDSQFVWTKSSYFVEISGAAQTESTRVIPLVDVLMTDTGSGRQFSDQFQPISNIAGHEGIPMMLPSPFIFKNNANINASFINVSGGSTYNNLRISLHGYRIYDYGNSVT